MSEDKTEEKIGIRDMLRAKAAMARFGFRITKEQADAASEGIQLFQHIITLSQEANTYVYARDNSIRDNPDYSKALSLIQQAKAELIRMDQSATLIGEMFPKMQEQLSKNFKEKYTKLCTQQLAIERLQDGLSSGSEDLEEIQNAAEERVAEEWI